ncbi:MAG TPA: 3-deoxy-D-manno-octulosonic acid transferase [Planctomycetaceae bacterium]|jgi:3-deoxy-D-manno-octulosonic-acid transferase|nr:3-deoxy-D-manno-octulosonic acid transferase [Planctomycetaceae bacterium]
MPWLLNLGYFALLAAVSPILGWRILVRGKYRTGWREKLLGQVTRRSGNRPCLWFHAVSVGEVLQLEPVLKELRSRLPTVEFVISTTTPTGRSVAEAKFSGDTVCYFPLDFSWAVREAISRLRPTAIVLVELELWPNFILHARRRGIPITLINGRLSEHSLRGYRRLRPLVSRLLGSLHAIAVQNATYAQRFVELGAPPERLEVTGSIKFDRVTTDRRNPTTAELRAAFGIAECDRVFVAGSTQETEESAALDTYLALRERFPVLRLILVPRHKERFEDVAQLVESRGLPLRRRSHALNESASAGRWPLAPSPPARLPRGERGADSGRATPSTNGAHTQTLSPLSPCGREVGGEGSPSKNRTSSVGEPVILLDTLGELSACWGLADVAFVGGSLTNRGGQNMIEPAGYGAAVLFGPNTQNFRDVVELLLSAGAARVVRNGEELTAAVSECLAHPDQAQKQGARAQHLVLSQQGATLRTTQILASLPGLSAATPGVADTAKAA